MVKYGPTPEIFENPVFGILKVKSAIFLDFSRTVFNTVREKKGSNQL